MAHAARLRPYDGVDDEIGTAFTLGSARFRGAAGHRRRAPDGWRGETESACASRPLTVQFSVQEVTMKTMSYTESRARYAEVLDGVANDREEVIITRAGHDPVVIVSLEDYESLRETAYLMRSPANARRLLDAMERLEAGRGEPHDLIDAD